MWAAIRELMEQFEEPVIVLDADGEVAVINPAAQEAITKSGSLQNASGVRVIGIGARQPEKPAVQSFLHLDQAASNLPVVLAIRSADQYLYISPTHAKLYGSEPELFRQNVNAFIELTHPEDRERVAATFEADLAGAAQEYECRIRHGNGEWRKVHVKVNPFLDSTTGQLLIASLVEDITEQQLPKRVEDGGPVLQTGADLRRAVDACVDAWSSEPDAPFFAVAFVDLVRFRAVNESFGYSGGDRLLEEVGKRLLKVLGISNPVAGFGSDRFAILLLDLPDQASAEKTMRDVLQAITAPFDVGGDSIQVAGRAGMAFPRGLDTSCDSLMRDADAALQLAKQRREELVTAASSKSFKQASLEFDLARALDNDEFFFEFQPVFDPFTGQVRLLEALVRWRHPRLGVISPSTFIQLAEDSGLVLRLDMQGLERLARQLEYWRVQAPEVLSVPVSINLSGRHFPNFVLESQFHLMLQSPALKLSKIVFEITESVFVDSNPNTAAGLERLREAGAEVWLDDFGDGYSSFRYLAHFPVDGIKICEALVKNCARDEKSRVILSSLQTLARGLGVSMVVEGVESQEQFDTLRDMGFDAVQGYFMSKPLGAKEIPELFAIAANVRNYRA